MHERQHMDEAAKIIEEALVSRDTQVSRAIRMLLGELYAACARLNLAVECGLGLAPPRWLRVSISHGVVTLNRRHHESRSFSWSGSSLVRTWSRWNTTSGCSFARVSNAATPAIRSAAVAWQ